MVTGAEALSEFGETEHTTGNPKKDKTHPLSFFPGETQEGRKQIR